MLVYKNVVEYKIVYYSRSGRCKSIAEDLSERLNFPIVEVQDDKDWSGVLGWLKAGYYSSKEKLVNVQLSDTLSKDDKLLVVTPLWAGKICPPIRTVLKKHNLGNIYLAVSSNGGKLKARSGFKAVYDIVRSEDRREEVLNQIVKDITS